MTWMRTAVAILAPRYAKSGPSMGTKYGEQEHAVMNGALVHDDDGIRIVIKLATTGETVLDLREEDRDFDNIVDMFGVAHQVKLLQIEHDLNRNCVCSTCRHVQEISQP
jgi:hypothetical protein